ncbi:D-glycero-beta-D-manno-heptose-1,7-bisphosphate 7-phosphatase [Sinobacterium norvegicum]|uniref:D,D-heptose 1,7-bisphosphate phosphatase n=1 Tax=Sinobacterium norvegicum TaxID=1641715 RepID=A0ABM9AIN5_9GAMM|nr:D-glycero-beta-D-manno-heptose 1,7-bisphosphate 7-phosphatase [Sinobacterium norvegicum]CAH0993014.1 D-glycero-beta-D-manno-heptose-1,7-bisphosphate 7-phosphatase [Sinobacterium norvegicum]
MFDCSSLGIPKVVILDRDGVINHDSDAYIKSAEEWLPIPGSIEAIGRLCQAGYQVYIATNQSGIGRGYYGLTELQQMHDKMQQLLDEVGGNIAAIEFCPHGPDEGCHCRKPLAGMIENIEQHMGCSAHQVPLIGDSLRDLEAGLLRQCQPVLVKTGKGDKTLKKIINNELWAELPVYDNLSDVVDALLTGEFYASTNHAGA